MIGTPSIADNVERLREGIALAAARAGRQADEVTLVGISKTRPAEAIIEAVRAGVHHIGENRVQEAAEKLPVVRQTVQPVLFHLVGHLQTNKAAEAVSLFDRVDSVDSLKVAQALSRRVPPGTPLPILLEVYVGDDPQRPGLRPETLIDTVGAIAEVPGLRIEGLLTVAPLGGDARAAFQQLRRMKVSLAEAVPRVHFGVLSMGMSEDYAVAIEEGSTEVRIGTALFGSRTAPSK